MKKDDQTLAMLRRQHIDDLVLIYRQYVGIMRRIQENLDNIAVKLRQYDVDIHIGEEGDVIVHRSSSKEQQGG